MSTSPAHEHASELIIRIPPNSSAASVSGLRSPGRGARDDSAGGPSAREAGKDAVVAWMAALAALLLGGPESIHCEASKTPEAEAALLAFLAPRPRGDEEGAIAAARVYWGVTTTSPSSSQSLKKASLGAVDEEAPDALSAAQRPLRRAGNTPTGPSPSPRRPSVTAAASGHARAQRHHRRRHPGASGGDEDGFPAALITTDPAVVAAAFGSRLGISDCRLCCFSRAVLGRDSGVAVTRANCAQLVSCNVLALTNATAASASSVFSHLQAAIALAVKPRLMEHAAWSDLAADVARSEQLPEFDEQDARSCERGELRHDSTVAEVGRVMASRSAAAAMSFGTRCAELARAAANMPQLALPPAAREALGGAAELAAIAAQPHVVAAFEETLARWMSDCDRIMAQRQAIFSAPPDALADLQPSSAAPVGGEEGGIGATQLARELEQWRALQIQLASIKEQLGTPHCRVVVELIRHVEGPAGRLAPLWERTEVKLQTALVEATENIRYLVALQDLTAKLFDPRASMSSVMNSISAAVVAIRVIHSVARGMGGTDTATVLLGKITQQVVGVCRRHVSTPTALLDNEDPAAARQRIRDCLALRDFYLGVFREEKAKSQNDTSAYPADSFAAPSPSSSIDVSRAAPQAPAASDDSAGVGNTLTTMAAAAANGALSASEAAVFGPLELLCARLCKLDEVLVVSARFVRLRRSGVDGTANLEERFSRLLAILKHRSGDYLDGRSNRFDHAFVDLQASLLELSRALVVIIDDAFRAAKCSADALHLHRALAASLQEGDGAEVLLEAKLSGILTMYLGELEGARMAYESSKSAPPTLRGVPPVAGAVAWAQQLQRQITGPMELLKRVRGAFATRDGRRAVKAYNALSMVLVEFQALWVDAWRAGLERARAALNATLLVQVNGRLRPNADPEVLQLMSEARHLRLLGVDIPPEAQALLHFKHEWTLCRDELGFIADAYDRLVGTIDSELCGIAAPVVQRLNEAINPGLVRITWTSTLATSYIVACTDALRVAEALLAQLNTTFAHRVRSSLHKIAATQWVVFIARPQSAYSSLTELLRDQAAFAVERAKEVNDLSLRVASAVREMVLAVVGVDADSGPLAKASAKSGDARRRKESVEFSREAESFYWKMEGAVVANIVESIRRSVSAIPARLGAAAAEVEERAEGEASPPSSGAVRAHMQLMRLRAELVDGAIQLSPTLDELQCAINRTARLVLEATRWIFRWQQRATQGKPWEVDVALAQVALVRRVLALRPEPSAAPAQERRASIWESGRSGARGASVTRLSPWGSPPTNAALHCSEAQNSVELDADDPLFDIGPPRNELLQDVYQVVGKDRGLTRVFLQLAGVVRPLQRHIDAFIAQLAAAEPLFAHPRDAVIDSFMQRHISNEAANDPFAATSSPAPQVADSKGGRDEARTTTAAAAEAPLRLPAPFCPSVDEFDARMRAVVEIEAEIDGTPAVHTVGCVILDLTRLAAHLRRLAEGWRAAYGAELALLARRALSHLQQRIDELRIRLSRPIHDLQDVSIITQTVEQVRRSESVIDARVQSALAAFELLHRYKVSAAVLTHDDAEAVDALVAARAGLSELCARAHERLLGAAPRYRQQLLADIAEFEASVHEFCCDYAENGPSAPGISPHLAAERLRFFTKKLFERERRLEQLRKGEAVFGLKQRGFVQLDHVADELRLLTQLYDLYNDVLAGVQVIDDTEWYDADFDAIQQMVARFCGQRNQLPRRARAFRAFTELFELLERLTGVLPYLPRLRERAVRPRHWEALARITGVPLDPQSGELRLKHLFDAKLHNITHQLDELLASAAKEADIEVKVAKLAADSARRAVTLGPYKHRGNLVLRSDATTELMQDLEDGQLLLASLLNSRFNEVFKQEILEWGTKLAAAQELLLEWLDVQHSWAYLEGVFVGTADIAREMPHEVKRFASIDRQWQKLMKMAAESPNLIRLTTPGEALATSLPQLRAHLDQCQKSLVGYMHSKRVCFPRFFFLSDAQLLDILGRSTDPRAIQPHLMNLTANVASLAFDSRNHVVEWTSSEGEQVRLLHSLPTGADVVQWMGEFLRATRATLGFICARMHEELVRAFDGDFWTTEVQNFMHSFPAQVTLLGLQMLWTADCEAVLQHPRGERAVASAKLKRAKVLHDALIVVAKDRHLAPRDRTKVEALIGQQIHHLDGIIEIARNMKKIRGVSDFDWQKQLRCNWRAEREEAVIAVTDVELAYGCEYIGCVERLVITGLTDRVYISCAQAMRMHCGGAPTGPAGTGKTETTRDLGRACGRYFIVINCSEMMDAAGVGRLVRGTAQSGCWCAFDEINRIEIANLSVIAAQIASVLHALRDSKKEFIFTDGSVVPLDAECAIFITMNPGYEGRTELPENMKSLFRNIAVVVPDRQAIIRVRLASGGFRNAAVLARRFHLLYQMCEEQLTPQRHYDFGLRSILAVLRTAGVALRESQFAAQSDGSSPLTQGPAPADAGGSSSSNSSPLLPLGSMSSPVLRDESEVLLKVISSMNLSKLVDSDVVLFKQLLADLFPDTAAQGSSAAHREVEEAIAAHAHETGFVMGPEWTARAIMLHDQWQVRHGIGVVGDCGCGKTGIVTAVADAVSRVHAPVRTLKLNPKALLTWQLFGSFDPKTADWTDGAFVTLWRKAARSKGELHWLLMDGPVDPVWIENLNSVLDDTRTLTLANGDRLPLPPKLSLFFETESLAHASPATVSRLGIVYVVPGCVTSDDQVQLWMRRTTARAALSGDVAALFRTVLQAATTRAVSFISQNRSSFATGSGGTGALARYCVSNILLFLDAVVSSWDLGSMVVGAQECTRAVAFSLYWGAASAFLSCDEDVDRFVEEVIGPMAGVHVAAGADATGSTTTAVSLATHGLGARGEWVAFSDVSNFSCTRQAASLADPSRSLVGSKGPHTAPLAASQFVCTVDHIRTSFVLSLLFNAQIPILVNGEAGCGKTATVEAFFRDVGAARSSRREKSANGDGARGSALVWSLKQLTFSYATTPTSLQSMVLGCVEKTGGPVHSPGPGKGIIFFVDDCHLPMTSEWGDQSTNELLRQLVGEGGSYVVQSHQPAQWAQLDGVFFCATLRTPDSSTPPVSARLRRLFALVSIRRPTGVLVQQICRALLTRHFSAAGGGSSGDGFHADVVSAIPAVVNVVWAVWQRCVATFIPTPVNFFYSFNMKDLLRLLSALQLLQPAVVVSPAILRDAVRHEMHRTFGDKLLGGTDQAEFASILRTCFDESFPLPASDGTDGSLVWTSLGPPLQSDRVGLALGGGDGGPGEGESAIAYQPQPIEAVKSALEQLTVVYNAQHKRSPIDVVWSTFFAANVVRIARVLATPRGHALLLGVGGSGKRLLSAMAAHVAKSRLVHFRLNAQTTFSNLVDEMKEAFRAAVQGRSATFLLTDGDELPPTLLEYANMILSSGELPPIFPKDELEVVHDDVRSAVRTSAGGKAEIAQQYTVLVRQNVHVLSCFSTSGDALRTRVRHFPAFLQSCTTLVIPPWPSEALRETALCVLSSASAATGSAGVANSLSQLADCAGRAHTTAFELCKEFSVTTGRSVHTTPKNFFGLLRHFITQFEVRSRELQESTSSVHSGLRRMADAQESVARMRIELEAKQRNVAKATADADAMLQDISQRKDSTEAKTKDVQRVRNELMAQAIEIARERESADHDMGRALPTLREAEQALRTINADDISAVKKFATPPVMVRRIMDGVLLLKRAPVDAPVAMDVDNNGRPIIRPSWTSARQMVGDMQFLQSLLTFRRESVDAEQVELLLPYISQEDFTVERARTACGSLAGLCTWIRSMITFYHIAKAIEPKRARLRHAEASLAKAQAALREAEGELQIQLAELDAIQQRFAEAQAARAHLQRDADATRRRLDVAEQLLAGLTSERMRWEEHSRRSGDRVARLPGDCLLAAAFLAYAGPFTLPMRDRFVETCRAALATAGIAFTVSQPPHEFLVADDHWGVWRVMGLQQDELSRQNAAILDGIEPCFPLQVDPHGQGKAWIARVRSGADRVIFTTLQAASFTAVLEDALKGGKTLIIEDIETDLAALSSIRNVVSRNFTKGFDVQRNAPIELAFTGVREVVVSPTFRLALSTKHPRPQLPAELFAQVAVVECGVTQQGLEDQLLSVVVQYEKEALELERAAVHAQIHECQSQLHECEQQLLTRLANAAGNMLDDSDLLDVLSNIKATVTAVHEKLAAACDTDARIGAAREEFRPVAVWGAALFFALVQMEAVSSMYVPALPRFAQLFRRALRESPPHAFPPKRAAAVQQQLVELFNAAYLMGFYAPHRPLFQLLVAVGIERTSGRVSDDAMQLLLHGSAVLHGDRAADRASVLLLLQRFPSVAAISRDSALALSAFRSVCSWSRAVVGAIESGPVEPWRAWLLHEDVETQPLPDEALEAASPPFLRLVLLRLLRPDRLMPGIATYVGATLGPRVASMAPPSIIEVATQAAAPDAHEPLTPHVCLLSDGADPSVPIELAARRLKIAVSVVSMGAGQEAAALQGVRRGLADGGWVLLQNAHLTTGFCCALSETLRAAAAKPAHPSFRLWLTAAPHPRFPVALLHQSVCLTDDPPRGLRAGLRQCYADVTQDQLEAVGTPEWRRLLFGAVFLFVTVAERKRFGALGWSGSYEFGTQDLTACTTFLYNQLYHEGGRALPWKALQYMVAEVHLGGRITDEFDKRVMEAYCAAWLSEAALHPQFDFAREIGAHPPQPAEGCGGPYYCPDFKTVAEYRSFVEQLPRVETPLTIGLHQSAAHAQNINEAAALLSLLVASTGAGGDGGTGGGGGGGGGIDSEKEQRILATLESCEAKLRPAAAFVGALNELAARHGNAPIALWIAQEVHKLLSVVDAVHALCRTVRDALAGVVAMTAETGGAVEALLRGAVPGRWEAVSWQCTATPSLATWLQHLARRLANAAAVLKAPRARVHDMSCHFFPRAMLTAVKQELARAHPAWSFGNVSLLLDVTKITDAGDAALLRQAHHRPSDEDDKNGGGADPSPTSPGAGRRAPGASPTSPTSPTTAGCFFVYGLHLVGACWDPVAFALRDPPPRALETPLPVFKVSVVLAAGAAQPAGDAPPASPTVSPAKRHHHQQQQRGSKHSEEGSPRLRSAALCCPLYKHPSRGGHNYVCDVTLRSDDGAAKWVLRGVAALSMTL